jgi:hypothetical protein
VQPGRTRSLPPRLTDLTLSVFEIQGDSSAGPGDGCGTAAGDSEGGGGVGGGGRESQEVEGGAPFGMGTLGAEHGRAPYGDGSDRGLHSGDGHGNHQAGPPRH